MPDLDKIPSEKPVSKWFDMFKELVGLFDTKFKATFTTIIVLALVYFIWKNDRDKDRLYGMVIEEVKKQVPAAVNKQVAPIKAIADSNKITVESTSSRLDTVMKSVKTTLKNVNKSLK